jgi:fido (protein-threonine AMPylation protein)
VAGPDWSDDDPSDARQIAANCLTALRLAQSDAQLRQLPTSERLREWHRVLYQGCAVPSAQYVGNYRGDVSQTDLIDYEVGLGVPLIGLPDRVGVWSLDVAMSVDRFFRDLTNALVALDALIPDPLVTLTRDQLRRVISVCAVAHGEWVRIHPFANGNGRVARLLANTIAMRYGLRPFVELKPRPADVMYARAARESMGNPPDFIGDHGPTVALFAHYLQLPPAAP